MNTLTGGSGDGLKDANQPRIEELRRNTPDGMAHWSGTGPAGTQCLTCLKAIFNGWKGSGGFSNLKPIRCRKFQEMMRVKTSPAFEANVKSCRFYEGGGTPPKRGKS